MREKAVDGAARNWMLSYQLKNVKSVHIDKYGWLNFPFYSQFESFLSISGLSQTSIVRDVRGRRPVSKQRFLINRNGT